MRESRGNKLPNVSTREVRARQRAQLNGDELQALAELIRAARRKTPRAQISHGQIVNVLEAAPRHVLERASVVRDGSWDAPTIGSKDSKPC